MATAATIDVLLRANTAQYRAAMISAGRTANQNLGLIRKEAAQTAASIQTLNRAAAGFIGFQALRTATTQLARVADGYSNIQAKVRLAAGENANLSQSMDQVFEVAQRTFNTFEGTSALVQRGSLALRNFGQDAETAFSNSVRLAEIFNKGLVVSGASASEAASAALQFSQALASGRFQGDEFRSVMENNSRFAQLLADSLGVTFAELRKMSAEGKLTTDSFLNLLNQTEALDAEFERMPVTIGRARTQLENAFTQFIGEADQAYQVSRTFASGLQLIAENIGPIVSALGQLAVVTGGALTARALLGVRSYAQAVLARADAEKAAAAATAQRAQAEAAANAVTLTRARSEQITAQQTAQAATADRLRIEQTILMAKSQEAMIRANALRATSEIQLARLSQQLTAVEAARLAATEALGAARQREVAANLALAGSNRTLSAAMTAAGVAGTAAGTKISLAMRASQAATAAMTVAARGLSSALALVGGPLGVVIIGLGLLATKLIGAKQEADALRTSALRAAEGLAELNRESSAGQILSAGSAALAERERLRARQAELQERVRQQRNTPNAIASLTGDDRKELFEVNAALAETERQLARTAKLAEQYRGAQQGAAAATAGAGEEAAKFTENLAKQAEALRLDRFEIEKGLKARLLLEAMQAQGVTTVEALDEATRKHIDTIVREKGAIDAANEARKGGISAAKDAEREAKRQAKEREKLVEAARQADTELQGILQAQAATLGGPAVQAAQAYANEMLRLLMIEQDLLAAGNLTTEQIAQLAKAREQASETYQIGLNAQHEAAQRVLEDIQFETMLLGLSAEAKEKEIALRYANAKAGTEEYAQISAAMEEYLAKQKQVAGQDFFRDTTKRLFVDAVSGAKSAKDAVNDFFDTLRQRALEALAERLMDQLFGPRGSTQGGKAGDGFASWIGALFSYDKGGYTGPGGKTQPAGVVHKGEVVWSQADIARAGGVGVVEAMRRGMRGYADGGWVSGSDAVAMRRPVDDGIVPAARRGISIGGDTIIIQGATSKRSDERRQIEKSRRMRRAVRELG